jgi:tetratricopeptide (TPR) repeat protein
MVGMSVTSPRSLSSLIQALALGLFVIVCAPQVGAQVETADDLAFLDELARAFERGGSHSARRDLDEYLLDFPDSERAHSLAAHAAWRRGEAAETSEHLLAAGDPDPFLRGQALLRLGRLEEALSLAEDERLPDMTALRLRVAALDGLGRRGDALVALREVTRRPDTSGLDGTGLRDLGWLLLYERRFELANQALVFADRELNGLQGDDYQLVDPEVLVLLGRTYEAARQTGSGGGGDRTLDVLNDILEQDPGNADALVVKARAYVYGNNGRSAQASLAQALARDPSHPGALVQRGVGRLLARQVSPAMADADTVLGTNPRHRDALALRAAALALTTRKDEALEAKQAFETAHPESSALAFLLGQVLQSHYRFEESIPELERALSIEPENEEPLPVLAQSLAHVGREQDALAALEEHLRRSPFPYPWRHNMTAVLETLADAVEVRSEGGFRLKLPPGEQEVYGKLLARSMDEDRVALAERWGHDPGEDVLVEVFDHHADFSVRTVGFEGFMALGACFGRVVTILSPLSEMRQQFVWRQTALHEYAHVVTLTLSNQRMPRWLSEGISVLEEKRARPWWDRDLEREVLNARANGLILPVTRMDELFQDGSTVMLGYYVGSLVAEVIEEEFGFDALRALVAAYADDLSTDQAVRRALGVAPEVLDRAVRDHVDQVVAARASVRPRYNEGGKELLRARALSGDDDALYELAMAYLDLGRTVDMDATLQRVIAREGESPRVARLLAERDLSLGRTGSALPRLETWAAGDDDEVDADGLVLLASLLVREGERERAIDVLQRARGLFPSDTSHGSALAMLVELVDPDLDPVGHQELMEAVVARDETSLAPREHLLELADEAGDAERGLALSAQILDIEPYEPSYRMDHAARLVDAGRWDEAAAQWRLVLGMRGDQLQVSSPEDLVRMQEEATAALTAGPIR